jgi:hypothetical protein
MLALSLGAVSLGLLTPRSVEAVAEALLAVTVLTATVAAAYRGDSRWVIGACCLLVPAVWFALGMNPNVPGLSVALIGTRKTTLIFLALAAGVLWPHRTLQHAERMITCLLVLGAVVSLGVHFITPGTEASLGRAAGQYTGLFNGKARLQGIFSGPFHVALLGSFFLLRGWHLLLTRGRTGWTQALPLIVLGVPLVILAEVRTAYVTLALGILLTLVVTPHGAARSRLSLLLRTSTLAAVLSLFLFSGFASNAALTSLPAIRTDSRATNRLTSISAGISAFARSPVVGNGPGSAGAADSAAFTDHFHLTADDEFIALLVEGGLVGIVAIAPLSVLLARHARALTDLRTPSSAALYCLLGFCATTNVFEAIPVSPLLAVFVGLALARATCEPNLS